MIEGEDIIMKIEELNALRAEIEALNAKLQGLTDEELSQVCGGFLSYYGAKIDPEMCNGCGQCAAVCPTGAITFDGAKFIVIEDNCLACETCLFVCPCGAVRMMG